MKSKFETAAFVFLGFGIVAITIEIFIFYTNTHLIKNASELNNPNTISLTAAIGSLVGGTASVFFPICSVVFFIAALKSQREEFSKIQLNAKKQQFESTFFNLLDSLEKIK